MKATEWGQNGNAQGLMPLNLQLFAEGADGGDGANAGSGDATGTVEGTEITYTKDDFEKRLQSETDKRVTEALNTQRAKLEQEFADKNKGAHHCYMMHPSQSRRKSLNG